MPTGLEFAGKENHIYFMDKNGAPWLWFFWVIVLWLATPVMLQAQSNDLDDFYEARDNAPAWSEDISPNALPSLLNAIDNARTHGLDPADYGLDTFLGFSPYPAGVDPDRFATRAYLDLARDLLQGRVPPDHAVRWPFAPRRADLPAHLGEALASNRIEESLEALSPPYQDYHALRKTLIGYQLRVPEIDGSELNFARTLHPGDIDPDVALLRARLEVLGEIEPVVAEGPVDGMDSAQSVLADIYDNALEQAVRRLQRQAHLDADGVVGEETLAWINISIERRIDELRVNLERWRWMPDDLGTHHIRVNLPDYRLQVFENGEPVASHDVIIGRPSRRSPVLSATMTHVIANPWWETPHSLAVRDELPLFQRDPGAVSRLGFQVIDRESGEVLDASLIDWSQVSASRFPYRLRQAPGPLNALGRVKLIFPNPHNTYLHDTPSRTLFERPARPFSSGCVRVQDPVGLAGWAVQVGTDLDNDAVEQAVESGRETRIELVQPIEVHFLYFTAFIDDDGLVQFVPDIYGRDDRVMAALSEPGLYGELQNEERHNQLALSVVDECSGSF